MIKVFKVKIILNIIIVTIIITVFIIKNKFIIINTVQTSNSNNNTYKILIDVEDSKLFLFENEDLIKIYKCSGGKWSTPSPIGTWSIISKAKWGEGFRWKLATGLMFLGDNLEFMEL